MTIESAGDVNTTPSQVRVVAGEIRNGRSSLSSTDKSAIGTDLSTAKGDVLIASNRTRDRPPSRSVVVQPSIDGPKYHYPHAVTRLDLGRVGRTIRSTSWTSWSGQAAGFCRPCCTIHFHEGGWDHVPGGAVGLGEVATIGVAASVGNAIYNATGWRPTELPVRPDRLLHGLRAH